MDIILLARTEKRDSYYPGFAKIYHEYRVRLIANDERDQHAKDYGENKLYSMKEVWVFEKGTILKQDDKIIKESWSAFDWAESAEQAAQGSTETSYLTAQSLHYTHQNAMKYHSYINTLQTQINGLKHAVRSLGGKYNDLYEQALKKKRLYSKAQKGKAPQNIIDQIKAELSAQYDTEMITLKAELETAKKALEGLQK